MHRLNMLLMQFLGIFYGCVQTLRMLNFALQNLTKRTISNQIFRSVLMQALRIIGVGVLLVGSLHLGRYLLLRICGKDTDAEEFKQVTLASMSNLAEFLGINVSVALRQVVIGVCLGLGLLAFNILLVLALYNFTPGLFLYCIGSSFTYPALSISTAFLYSANFQQTVIYAPIFEEIVFRFMLIGILNKIGQAYTAACSAINSLATKIMHFFQRPEPVVEITTEPIHEKAAQPESDVEAALKTAEISSIQSPQIAKEHEPEINRGSILVSALLFSAAHTGGPLQNICTFVSGVALGYIYQKTDSLKMPIACHMANNAGATLGATLIRTLTH